MPGTNNGVLDSPLAQAQVTQPFGYSIASSLALSAPPASLTQSSPQLAVYPLVRTIATVDDVIPVATGMGVQGLASVPALDAAGNVVVQVNFDNIPYTLTLGNGYGGVSISLQAVQPRPGTLSATRLATQAPLWLRAHGLSRPDIFPLGTVDGDAVFGQRVGGVALLGPGTIRVGFDAQGVLRDLTWAYATPGPRTLRPALLPNPALSQQLVAQGQALYQGPPTTSITGQAVISGLNLAYVGVRGPAGAYLEPIYVLDGTAPTVAGQQALNLYVPALSYGANG